MECHYAICLSTKYGICELNNKKKNILKILSYKESPLFRAGQFKRRIQLCVHQRGIFTPSVVRLSVNNVAIVDAVPRAIFLSTCSALVTNLISELLSYTSVCQSTTRPLDL